MQWEGNGNEYGECEEPRGLCISCGFMCSSPDSWLSGSEEQITDGSVKVWEGESAENTQITDPHIKMKSTSQLTIKTLTLGYYF